MATPEYIKMTDFLERENLMIKDDEMKTWKRLRPSFWKESPIKEDEMKKYWEYEREYINKGILSLTRDEFKRSHRKRSIEIELPMARKAYVRADRKANVYNPNTGERSVKPSALIIIKQKNGRYKKQLREVIDFLNELED